MTTLSIMVARITDELSRSDLESQVRNAIGDAIAAFASERFYFSESRTTVSFSTVLGTQFYGSSPIDRVLRIDWMTVDINGVAHQLSRIRPDELDRVSTSPTVSGQPTSYAWYGQQIGFYPVPRGVYSVRLGAHITVAAPATDAETGNPWMIDAERLIRSRAKHFLALDVLQDEGLASRMSPLVEQAFTELKSKTTLMTGTGRIRSMAL